MVARPSMSGDTIVPLDAGWTLIVCEPGAATTPDEAAGLAGWIAARVPGTAEQTLRDSGATVAGTPSGLHDKDVWYRTTFQAEGSYTLRLQGLASHAEVFLDGRNVCSSRSMFVAHEIDIEGRGRHDLAIRCLALNPILAAAKGPRARWRPMMITPGTLRLVRTTALGHMPGWAPPVAVVGPWKPVELIRRTAPARITSLRLIPTLAGANGVLDIAVTFDNALDSTVELACGGHAQALHRSGDATFSGRLTIEQAAPWWPHTHGEPALHDAALRFGGVNVDLGRVGFRSIAIDRGEDGKGFALIVNGERIFCRGASWMPVDPAAPASADPRAMLALAREAGMNMIRISGTMMPESRAFHEICDEFGILVWHDLPFANFDYPAGDPAFVALVETETRQLLDRLQASPSLAVVCGGSEIAQQATMLGVTPVQATMPLFDEVIPRLVAAHAPNTAYVPHTPWGGPLPFVTDEGVTHYFGVGAYCRPMEDVRRSRVRFATECLAFANVPAAASLRAADLADPASEAWKAGIPRDAGADWDFEDVRDHYVRALYGADPEGLRRDDPERYLALGRAAPAEIMEQVFAEWRRAGSRCGGALVWFLNDLMPGAGWGVIDRTGEPKTTWHALRRAFRPLHLGLTDEGLNGLGIHLVNETAETRHLTLTLACYGEGVHPLARAETPVTLPPRSAESTTTHALLGRFFDIVHAYRFGPLTHDATLARLVDPATGVLVAEACHVIAGRAATPRDIGLSATVTAEGDGFALHVASARMARFVTVDDDDFRAGDEGFCLAPGETRVVPLIARRHGRVPRGAVAALNSLPVAYGSAA